MTVSRSSGFVSCSSVGDGVDKAVTGGVAVIIELVQAAVCLECFVCKLYR